jgi:hypothetical protein
VLRKRRMRGSRAPRLVRKGPELGVQLGLGATRRVGGGSQPGGGAGAAARLGSRGRDGIEGDMGGEVEGLSTAGEVIWRGRRLPGSEQPSLGGIPCSGGQGQSRGRR